MKIAPKLTLGYLTVALLIGIVGYLSVDISQETLQKSIGEGTLALATETISKIDRDIYNKVERWRSYSATNPVLQQTLLFSNQEFEKLDNIQAYINQKDQEWVSVSNEEITPFMQELINNELSQRLRYIINFYEEEHGYKVFGEVFVTNKYGANAAQTGKTADYRQDDEGWWQLAKKDGLGVLDVEYDSSADVCSTDIGIGISDKAGNFIGAMKVVLNIRDTITIIKELEETETHQNAKFKLLTKDGRTIYSTEEFELFEDAPERLLSSFREKQPTGYFRAEGDKPGEGEELFTYAHSKGYRDFKGLGWILVVEHKIKEILKPVFQLRMTLLIISFIILLSAVLIGLFLSRRISVRINKLKDAAVKIGEGRLDTRIEIRSKDEIETLASSFKKMAQDLEKTTVSKDYLDNIIGSMLDSMVVIDPDSKISAVNKATCNLLGYKEEELIGKDATLLFSEEETPLKGAKLKELIEEGELRNYEMNYKVRDGRIVSVLLSASVLKRIDCPHQGPAKDCQVFKEKGRHCEKILGVICVAKDIAERKKMEEKLKKVYKELKEAQEKLIQSEKMASIGQLAAGAAHEINNPLAAISGEAEILLKYKDQVKDPEESLKTIVEQTKRIEGITRRLLEFARRREFKTEPLDMNNIIEKSVSLLSYQVKAQDIEIIRELTPDLPEVPGDANQLQEVFLNIMLNSAQAMKEKGKLTIKTYLEEIREPGRRKTDVLKNGQKVVVIEFNDTGEGMDEETLRRVFDPFFTTKEKNTGLGLSICYGIIRNHNGIIKAESKLGEGSTFIIKLPLPKGGKRR